MKEYVRSTADGKMIEMLLAEGTVHCFSCEHFHLHVLKCPPGGHFKHCNNDICFTADAEHPKGSRTKDYKELNKNNDCKYWERKLGFWETITPRLHKFLTRKR